MYLKMFYSCLLYTSLDDDTRFIKATVFNGPVQLNLMYVSKAMLNATKPDGNEVQYECLLNTSTNEITIALPQQLLAVPGDVRAEIQIEMDDKSSITTGVFIIRVERAAITGTGFESTKEDVYKRQEYARKEDISTVWTIQSQDIVVKGLLDQEIRKPTDLVGQEMATVVSYSDNRQGSLPHWRIGGV